MSFISFHLQASARIPVTATEAMFPLLIQILAAVRDNAKLLTTRKEPVLLVALGVRGQSLVTLGTFVFVDCDVLSSHRLHRSWSACSSLDWKW